MKYTLINIKFKILTYNPKLTYFNYDKLNKYELGSLEFDLIGLYVEFSCVFLCFSLCF